MNSTANIKIGVLLSVIEPVYFAMGVSVLKTADINRIHYVVGVLRNHPELKVLLVSVAETKGSIEENKLVAFKRLHAVKEILLNNEIADSCIQVETEMANNMGAALIASGRIDVIIFK